MPTVKAGGVALIVWFWKAGVDSLKLVYEISSPGLTKHLKREMMRVIKCLVSLIVTLNTGGFFVSRG